MMNLKNYICIIGYGIRWESLQEIKLLKGAVGYEGDLFFDKSGDVNFCFRGPNGLWDNNNGKNYTIYVSNDEQSLIPIDNSYLPQVPQLKMFYLIRRKIKVAFYKTISLVGKLLTGEIIDYFKSIKQKN